MSLVCVCAALPLLHMHPKCLEIRLVFVFLFLLAPPLVEHFKAKKLYFTLRPKHRRSSSLEIANFC